MRSIPLAMTWEFLVHGKWPMLLGMAGSLATPLLLATLMRDIAPEQANSPLLVFICFTFSLMGMFVIGVCVVASREPLRQWRALPISNMQLVLWQMLHSMIAMGVLFTIHLWLVSWAFRVEMPITAPVVFSLVLVAGFQVAAWQQASVTWAVGYWLVAVIFFSTWYGWLHGNSLFRPPIHTFSNWRFWREVSVMDALMMVTVIAVCATLGIRTVASVRRGDTSSLLTWIYERLDGLLAQCRSGQLQFMSPYHALRWSDWRECGWRISAVTLAVTVFGLGAWSILDRSSDALFNGFLVGGAILLQSSFVVGGTFGLRSLNKYLDLTDQLGNFFSTLPIPSAQIARVKMGSLAISLFCACSIWAAVYVVAYWIAWYLGTLPPQALAKNLGWWYVPLVGIGCWILAANCMTIVLTGRVKIFIALAIAMGICFFATDLFVELGIPPVSRATLENAGATIIGSVLLIGTIFFFWLAVRKSLTTLTSTIVGWTAWLVGCGIVAYLFKQNNTQIDESYILASGALALAILPLATSPLAIQWNRVR